MPKPIEKILGKKLADIRRAKLATQQEWANALGWSTGNLRRIEGMEVAGIDLTSFRDLATLLNKSPDDLRSEIGASDEVQAEMKAAWLTELASAPPSQKNAVLAVLDTATLLKLGQLFTQAAQDKRITAAAKPHPVPPPRGSKRKIG